MRPLIGAAALGVALVLAGCMPPYVANPGVSKDGTLYHGSTGPLSYEAPTLRDGGASLRAVSGEACQYSIVLPIPTGGVTVPDQGKATGVVQLGVGWGNGGYANAMANAEKEARGEPLVDIRADRHFTTVLWIYRRDCVEIHASAAPRIALPR